MKLHAKCERCGKYGEVFHSPGSGGLYLQMQQASAACSFNPSQGWRAIDGKYFCGDCAAVIQVALDDAMRPVAP